MNHISHLLKELKSETKIRQDTCTFPVVKAAGVNLKRFDIPIHVNTKSCQKVLKDKDSFVRFSIKIYSSL